MSGAAGGGGIVEWEDRLDEWELELGVAARLEDSDWVPLERAAAETGASRAALRSWYRTGQVPSRLVDGPHGPQRLVPLTGVATRPGSPSSSCGWPRWSVSSGRRPAEPASHALRDGDEHVVGRGGDRGRPGGDQHRVLGRVMRPVADLAGEADAPRVDLTGGGNRVRRGRPGGEGLVGDARGSGELYR